MAEGKQPLTGNTAFEQTAAELLAKPLPAMVVIDADNVLWPSTCERLDASVTPYVDAPAVLSALHARGIRLALVACPSPGATAAEGAGAGGGADGAVGKKLEAALQGAVDRAGLSGIIEVLHVLEADAAGQEAAGGGAALQPQCEAHWQALRYRAAVTWASCLALVGSAGSLRAANRAGAASVLVRGGLGHACITSGLEVWEAKAEDERGF